MGRQRSLIVAAIAEFIAKAIAVQRKSLGFLAKVILDNRIVLDYLLAKKRSVP